MMMRNCLCLPRDIFHRELDRGTQGFQEQTNELLSNQYEIGMKGSGRFHLVKQSHVSHSDITL